MTHEPIPNSIAPLLARTGSQLYARGWLPATSGNLSARGAQGRIAITVSGRDKGSLGVDDIMWVDGEGRALDDRRPSDETLLHTGLYRRFADVGAVLHTHSVNATVLSRLSEGQVALEGYELLKAFRGIETHHACIIVPVFANDQDIARLARRVDEYLDAHASVYGYLIAGHGLYTWGQTIAEAVRYLEAFECLFECELRIRGAVL